MAAVKIAIIHLGSFNRGFGQISDITDRATRSSDRPRTGHGQAVEGRRRAASLGQATWGADSSAGIQDESK